MKNTILASVAIAALGMGTQVMAKSKYEHPVPPHDNSSATLRTDAMKNSEGNIKHHPIDQSHVQGVIDEEVDVIYLYPHGLDMFIDDTIRPATEPITGSAPRTEPKPYQ